MQTDNVDVTGGTSNLRISGLPFTVAAGNAGVSGGYVVEASNFAASVFPLALQTIGGGTQMVLIKRATSNGAIAACVPADLTAGNTADQNVLVFVATYFV
jgi:hypothetical protein